MRITAIETITYDRQSNLTNPERDLDITTLRVHTDKGLVGLGETFPQAGMETAALLGPIAEQVLGADPRDIQGLRDDLLTYFNYYGHAGAEMRALSAFDIACWDLKGQHAGEPIYQLLGGRARDAIPAYNTSYDQDYDFREDPVGLAESLLGQGVTAMKIWPFDPYADETRGQRISTADVEAGLEPLRLIREAVGHRMDVALEFHGRWALTPAKKIVRAAEAYDPLWVEDVIRKGNPDAYARLAAATEAPLCISERLMGRYEFTQAIETGAIDIAMLDICWTGGFSEARAIADMAEAAHLPVAPHNSGGPVLHRAGAHLAATIPNLYIMETIRDRYDGWHNNLVTEPLSVEDGALPIPKGPGLGTAFDESLLEHPDTTVQRVELDG